MYTESRASENNAYAAACLPRTYTLFSEYIVRVRAELEQVREQAIERKTINNDFFFEVADRIGLLNVDAGVELGNLQ